MRHIAAAHEVQQKMTPLLPFLGLVVDAFSATACRSQSPGPLTENVVPRGGRQSPSIRVDSADAD